MIISLILAAILVQDAPPDEPAHVEPAAEGPTDGLVAAIRDNLTRIDELYQALLENNRDNPDFSPDFSLGPHLDAEVSPSDHDAVGNVDDLLQTLDRLRLLDLGDDGDAAVVRHREALGQSHVLGAAHEREGEIVGAEPQGDGEVFPVLVGERRSRDLDVGQVDSLVVLQSPAGDDDGLDVAIGDVGDGEG